MFVMFVGNMMLHKDDFFQGKKDGLYHLVYPRALDAAEKQQLLQQVNSVVTLLRKYFAGEIVVLGPWPRHLKPSPKHPQHYISGNKDFSMVAYTQQLNQHLKAHLVLPARTFF